MVNFLNLMILTQDTLLVLLVKHCGGHQRYATRTFEQGGTRSNLHRTANVISVKDAWKLYHWARRWAKRQELA
ncbi:MAG: hypothetical protein WAX80_00455 [Minisyncoccia bacterium]